MGFKRGQAPADLDAEGLRKFVEEQLLRIQRATGEMDTSTTAIEADILALQTSVNKLTNNQFARVHLGSNLAITASTFALMNFDSVTFDPTSIWDATNKRFKPTIAGYYRVYMSSVVTWTGANVQIAYSIAKNGSEAARGLTIAPPTTFFSGVVEDIMHFNGNTDYVDFHINSGGTTPTLFGGSPYTFANISLVKAD